MADAGALPTDADPSDRRKVQIELHPHTRLLILERASNSISIAIALSKPELTPSEIETLQHHLAEADRMLGIGRVPH